MHWWQIAIRLILVANCFGSFREATRAGRDHHLERLHWLVPKAIAWTGLFFALLPARWGGVGMNHWEFVVYSSIILLLYGIIIEKSDSVRPALPWGTVEIPHFGYIEFQFIPHLLVVFSLLVASIAVGESIHLHRITADDKIFLVASSLGLLFGVRLCLCQYSLSRPMDLIRLAKIKPPPPETPAQHDWIRPDDQ